MSEEDTVENWDELMDPVVFSIRTTRSDTTKYTLFQLMYGREALIPVEEGDKDIPEVGTVI